MDALAGGKVGALATAGRRKTRAAEFPAAYGCRRAIGGREVIASSLNSTFANLIYSYHFHLDSSIFDIATPETHDFARRSITVTFRRMNGAEEGTCMR